MKYMKYFADIFHMGDNFKNKTKKCLSRYLSPSQ